MEKTDFDSRGTRDNLCSGDVKKVLGHPLTQSKAQFILPVDLRECNTQTEPQ